MALQERSRSLAMRHHTEWALGFRIVSGFAEPITYSDCRILRRQWGSHESQQAFEGFAILVAVWQWLPFLRQTRARLCIESDNRGALAVVSSLKGSGDALTLVAKELALDCGSCEFIPQVIQHIPDLANCVADALSRKFDPDKQPWHVPDLLRGVDQAHVPARGDYLWKVHSYEQSLIDRQATRD